MSDYSIKLLNIIDSINDTKSIGISEGFLFKYLNEIVLISVHHFKPIITTLINTTEKPLLITKKNVFWNELLIFNNPNKRYTLNTKVIPVIIDYGKSHVIYQNKFHKGKIHWC